MKTTRKAVVIGMAVLALAAGFWLWQRNQFSKDAVRVEIVAPADVRGGEEFAYVVKVKHNGSVRLEDAQLLFEYPRGAVPGSGFQLRETRELEDVYPGQERSFSFPGRLFGKEGEVREARAVLNYRPKELTARFASDTSVATKISSTPLSFELDTPAAVEREQQFSFQVNYFSQSSYPFTDLRLKLEYPGPFSFAEAIPAPLGENEWKIAVLNQGDGGRITVRGSIQGGSQAVELFRAQIGMWREGEFTVLAEQVKGVEVGKPNVALTQTVNGQEQYVASPGELLHYEISFKNLGERNLENLFLALDLEGRPFDFSSVSAPKGTFRPGDASLSWEPRDVPKLRFLGRGEEGSVEFWVSLKEEWETFSPQDKNFQLVNTAVLGDTERNFQVKVAGRFQFEQTVSAEDAVFANTGPAPPIADQPTTYTVTWEAGNSFTAAEDAKAVAVLPSWVQMTGQVNPANSSLTFDSASREVVWDVGGLEPGIGTLTEPRSVSFQVKLTPLASQKGSPATLVEQATLQGQDAFAGRQRSASASALLTPGAVQ